MFIFGKVKSFANLLLSTMWKPYIKLKILVRHGDTSSSWEAVAGGLRVQGQSGLTMIYCLKEPKQCKSLETAT